MIARAPGRRKFALLPVFLLMLAHAGDAQAAIRKLSGRHLTLLTDVPPSAEVDELPEVFDRAVAQWGEYFHVPKEKYAAWRVTGYLMQSREAFEFSGLLPRGVPEFKNGYSQGEQLWLHEQKSDYYRRHLLLHEGTHSFMGFAFDSLGPPWYAEGIAELLATHRWSEGRLTLKVFPRAAADVPRLGRIKMVQDAFAAGHAISLPRVMAYDRKAHLENEPYGWCWAAAFFLDSHPAYCDRFRAATAGSRA